ncbi:hypothetical protein Tco_0977536 [Tanacetum coccineum]|uniref:Reverse transcriptase domain-containing protein n=1 Tax=Tanacetum coccineum TaxID=301880 RepID=A0ABQ5EKE1_9ASTR
MSPYLFTLVMELLTLIILRRIRNSNDFRYHQCKELQVVNLCFADDLNGVSVCAGIIKDALNEFSSVSGMFPNLNKSSIFFGSMNSVEKQRIVEVMQFQEGTLPTKYLGVPLVTKKLGLRIVKVSLIRGRTEDWKCKHLSYAGRLMLIAAVLESINTAKGRAKVAWKHICKPKEKGGLGIKDLETWNDALLSKHSDSWNWKCLLKIRDKMADSMKWEMGGISVCGMKWHDSGLLIVTISNGDLYDERIPKMISIDDMIKMGVWKWPNEWNSSEFEVMEIRPPRLQTGMIDKVIWNGKDNTLVPFNTKLVMDALSQNYEKS